MTLRRVAIALIALQCIGLLSLSGLSQAEAATSKPKPKVTSTKIIAPKKKVVTPKKVVAKKKTVVKKKTITKAKVTTKTKVTTKKKTTLKKKATPKKKVVVHHYVYHKPVFKPVQPSPSPSWPPKGFTSFGFAYARIPTGAELIGILSAAKKPSTGINSCASDPKHPKNPAYSCAAILVASSEKCTWWEITSTVTGVDPANSPSRIPLGDITTYAKGETAKTIQTIFLVSPIPLQTGVRFTAIRAICGTGPANNPVPSTSFTPVAAPSASPTDSATPTSTDSATPTPSPTS